MRTNHLTYFFDKEADVLYVASRRPSVRDSSEEIGDGIIVRRNAATKKITGFTIVNFLARQKSAPTEIALPLRAAFEVSK